ncbi:hypothetical protein [Sphingomonas sp. So64.6b]|uniref:hypothetical protein n=1 Tax=Sphingomonas sp. So64.6b TaxID=2997354 RepID=UPI001FCE5414|nr:hypothetical protein [Sphingomonas sp. So64.6b]
MPIGAIVLLARPGHGEDELLERLANPAEIVGALGAEIFRPTVAAALGRKPALFGVQAAIAGSVPVHRWRRRFEFDRIEGWLDRIEALVAP